KLLESSGLLQPVRHLLADGLPAFGTCAGMILLAGDVLGAIEVSVERNAYGTQRDSFETSLDVEGLRGGPFPGVFIRAPAVSGWGPGVEVLARPDARPVLLRQGRVWVSSFHPELSGDLRLHQRFFEEVGSA